MKRIIISGYYGYNNIGDELLAESFSGILRKNSDACITVLCSKNTGYSGAVHTVNRMNPLKIIYTLARSDVFVAGGGSQFQDASGSFSFWYYFGLALGAKLLGNRVCLEAQGFGPFKSRLKKRMCGFIAHIADSVSVRDEKSLKFIEKFGKIRAIKVPDPAIWLLAQKKYEKKPQNVVIIPRKWKNKGRDLSCAAELADFAGRCEKPVVLLAVSPEDREECMYIKRLTKKAVSVYSPDSAEKLMQILSNAESVVSVRLHGCIAAVCADVPCAGIEYDPKIKACAQEFGFQSVKPGFLHTINFLRTVPGYDILQTAEYIEKTIRTEVYG